MTQALVVSGSPTWTRTRDLRINSPSLYRLSYQGIDEVAILMTVDVLVNTRNVKVRRFHCIFISGTHLEDARSRNKYNVAYG